MASKKHGAYFPVLFGIYRIQSLYFSKPNSRFSLVWQSEDRIRFLPLLHSSSTIQPAGYGSVRYPREMAPVLISKTTGANDRASSARDTARR